MVISNAVQGIDARFSVARFKPRPANFRRTPCLGSTCKRASVRGRLCAHCHDLCLASVNRDLSSLGIVVERVSVSDAGYVMAHVPNSGRPMGVGVHRIAMQAMIGRALVPGENVHHRNGDRGDNRPANLELWVTSQPAGQRPEDLAQYARELLARYGTTAERRRYS